MKNLLLFFGLTFGVTAGTLAQEYKYVPFPDSGAIWSEVYYYGESSNFPDTSIKPPDYERFALSGEDTVINDVTYHKVYLAII